MTNNDLRKSFTGALALGLLVSARNFDVRAKATVPPGEASQRSVPPQEPAYPRIVIGPNVLVSRDPGTPRTEPHLAAHPSDPNKLAGMAITLRDEGTGQMLELYSSSDGGQTWKSTIAASRIAEWPGDPIVGFTPQGTALAAGLGNGGMWVYRSADGGATWDNGRKAGRGDHERLAIDDTVGQYAGRAYLAAEASGAQVWRSTDDGVTWIGPVPAARDSTHGIAVKAMTVLSDGRVVLILSKYPNPNRDLTTPSWETILTTSVDGGVTWSAPQSIAQQYFGGYGDLRRRHEAGLPGVAGSAFDAAADTHSQKFRDRIYMVYTETRAPDAEGRLVFSLSGDGGRSWRTPKDLISEPRADVSQFQPAMAVNSKGTVAVIWCGTRETHDQFDVYFTASVDGGETFLAPVRLSNESSRPFAASDVRPVPAVISQSVAGVNVSMLSAYSRWPNGGDYIGLSADAAGVFHPFWADARTGTYQVYTSRVEVIEREPPPTASPSLERQVLTDKVTLTFDPIDVDWSKRELSVPVRLRNTSTSMLYGPFVVEIMRMGSSRGSTTPTFEILNATNGERGAGAQLDYGTALRDLPGLAPGGVSDAVMWRLRPSNMRHTEVSFIAEISGYTPSKVGMPNR